MRLYLILGALALALVVAGGAYFQGRSDGAAKCEARWLTREATRIQQQNEAIEERDNRVEAAQLASRVRSAERLAQIDGLQGQVEAYEAIQATRPDDDCGIDAGDAGSLSNIR